MRAPLNTLIPRLWCRHWPDTRLTPDKVQAWQTAGVFLDTCLRQLAFGLGPDRAPLESPSESGEYHTGGAAYQLLLEVTSGLRSAVLGETNVFGQFQRAWARSVTGLSPGTRQALQSVVHAVQADTRALRSSHLAGLAGNSYGSLVRGLLAPQRDARVLFIGMGDLARSMLPLFSAFEVGVWNRRHGAPLSGVCRWFSPDEAHAAAGWATDLVFTTPEEAAHDAAWQERLAPHALRGLVHLGQRRSGALLWPSVTAAFHLDDVLALASRRDQRRRIQQAAALEACQTLVTARLRGARPESLPPPVARAIA